MMIVRNLGLAASLLAAPQLARAQDFTTIAANDTGDTAWTLVASALVLLLAVPGLALNYAGQVRTNAFLSVFLQIGAIAGLVSLLWVVVGYTLAFGSSVGGLLGDGRAWMLIDLVNVFPGTAIPESTFALYQMTIAILACALIVGAWAERARFGWVITFAGIWSLLVYTPIAHWIWGNGWLSALGVRDFGGGLVVHTAAGVSALVVALLLGNRRRFSDAITPSNAPSLALVGAMLMWVGWFGFNGGRAFYAGDDASMAIINTQVAGAVAVLTWLLAEKVTHGKPTALGFAKGLIAGLACVTPAAGFISPGAAVFFGIVGALASFGMIGLVKRRWRIDDTLDVFALHAVSGILGTLMLAFFASEMLGGTGYEGGGMAAAFVAQTIGIATVTIYAAIITAIIAVGVSLFLPMRVSEEEEARGLDAACHGERGRQAQ